MRISLAMIVRDEELVLDRCLQSVTGIFDEIIIVDTGSHDRTKKIARKFTDKVYDFVWCDDFSKARNFAFSKATGDFIMWLDADDVITPENAKRLKDLLNGKCDWDILYMKYDIWFDELGKPTFSYYRERIVRRGVNPVWVEPVHEVIIATGRISYSDISVEHRKIKQNPGGRNLKIMERVLAGGGVLSPRLTYYYARELMWNNRTNEAIATFEKFLVMPGAWSENKIGASFDLANCYIKFNNSERALQILINSFAFDRPRAEICCKIGEIFFTRRQYETAKYWYLVALKMKIPKNNFGFVQVDYYNFVPAMQLAVIYDKMGRHKTANKYNEIAGKYKPNDPSYLYNKKYFSSYITI
ncbi:MAG: glycosyltransferase [Christensenellaceae bacterium]|jgi:glycosyltransferase involved in cell wall biosynthesis|nr:glycosyltransferase [Christensenellaceae bacterium]